MHSIESIESAIHRLEQLIQRAIFLRSDAFDTLVAEWLHTTQTIGPSIGLQEIAAAAAYFLHPEGSSAHGRELLLSLPLSFLGELDHFSVEEKKVPDDEAFLMGLGSMECEPEVECWLLWLAIGQLSKVHKYKEGLRLCSAAQEISTHHMQRIVSEGGSGGGARRKQQAGRYTGIRPILSKIYVCQSQLLEQYEARPSSAEMRRRPSSRRRMERKRSLDSKETQLHMMLNDLKINRRAGGELVVVLIVLF